MLTIIIILVSVLQVSQTEFCTHFETALPTDAAGFEEAITQFTAAAMLVQERKKSGT